ncbi:uncharacterized protein LOC107484040 [Arachis duranensis]|uniref:Uncharacterized protein LOC107484040 n=1 Tax=Arachis duranensis TaxID=130453 RepID=A0A6P4D314_ARADU|nr:uncharacterized protein LOC107484040 [Arachis duranensis]
MSHLHLLHITTTLSGIKVNKVLIDGGAAISLLPERMLMKVGKHPGDLVPTNIAITDFSGASTPAKVLVTLTVKVGSSKRNTMFVVVPSKTSYNALLGRDWIHGVGTVPSTVHQSMLLWSKDGKPKVIKVDLSLYVELLHVDFRMYNPKLKPLNIDRTLNSYNCEGCYLSSEGNKDDSSDEVESHRIRSSFNDTCIDSISSVDNAISQTTHLIAEEHCVENRNTISKVNDPVYSISNEIVDFTFDCIYGLEPLGFEKYFVKDEEHFKGFESQDPLEEINLGTPDDVQITYICKGLVDPFRTELFHLLHEFKDCFAWDYYEMPGLDHSLVEYRLALKSNARPVKQTPRHFSPEINENIKEEIEHLIKVKFTRTTRYVEWVLNIVPVMKKNGKLRVCLDFRDLNNVIPKDECFMPIADMLIDSAAGNKILSFMDGYSGYNQIFIAEDDVSKITFRCPGALGTYEWVVMPFGLKNAGATYQRAMNAFFHEFIGKFMEVYIDDVMVKSISVSQHIYHLRKAFVTIRKKGLKMNPLKCSFGVSAGNFLGFVVHKKGIAIDKNKADAILALYAPKSKKEVQSLLGKFEWTNEHQLAFDSIKAYLSKAPNPIIANVRPHEPLKLYIAASMNTIGCMLAQDDENGHERAVIAQTDLIKYMLSFLMLRGRLGKWMLSLTEFDLQYVLAKAVKGQVIAEFLVSNSKDLNDQGANVIDIDIDYWKLYFDGSKHKDGAGVGILIISLEGFPSEFLFELKYTCSNNVAEYEALILGLEILISKGVLEVQILGNSQLVLKQLSNEFKCNNERL